MTDLVLRDAAAADLDALVRLEDRVFPGDRLDRRAFRYALGSPTIDMRVAYADGAMLGYVQIQRRRGARVARLTSVAVSPEAHGQGVGRRLVSSAEALARENGCTALRLEVRADNARARGLYERAGYALFASVPDYYEDGEAALRFEKALAAPPS